MYKRISLVLFTIVLIIQVITIWAIHTTPYRIVGDINHDGLVNALDITALERQITNMEGK